MIELAKRSYNSKLRTTQAEATRQAILDAARRVCCMGGWPNATIATIAKEAGVAKETIYAIFGSKVTLIGEMVKASVAKSVPGKHFLDEERPRAISAEIDQARQIELWAIYLSEIMERVSPLMAVVRSGSEVEPEMGELYRALHKGRRANLSVLANSILNRGTLRNGLSVETTTDILWQLASPEMFHLLTTVGGFSTERYAEWLTGMLKATLLRPDAR
ncbi:TetR/AcrR family transcriptional regulator [Tunturiibacter lichenicola]|uniref:TetR/AcrR family transcriptional regulator n=1 Tax=Tunturiibacter lichenicola TaxID=2051959 RepID=UPI0021B37E4F|nr:TetR/AcrR family transcriptional regulator [Edaphobacter lichenicola]